MAKPLVSVAMANFNGERFLQEAIDSALAQDIGDLEVIVVDDASTDRSVAIALEAAARDPRVRVEALPSNRGPGGARNRAIELARGDWLVVLDSDDLMHPSRLSRLLAVAEHEGAEIVADDLLIFHQDDLTSASRFLQGRRAAQPTWVTPEDFLLETRMYGRDPNLGYLKPVVRLQSLRAAGVRYDEALSIGEDHDLLLRLLAAGLRFRLEPSLGYFYRKHTASISHRLGREALDRMEQADADFRASAAAPSLSMTRALDRRLDSIKTAQVFTDAVDALKAGRPMAALGAVASRPQAALLFRMPVSAAVARIARRIRPAPSPRLDATDGKRLSIISRQRLTGRTNGSSSYLIDIAHAARRAGYEPHLVQPSPLVLGRWPVLRFRPEMKVFESISLRGVARLGDFAFSHDPSIYMAAARGAAAQLLSRLSLPCGWLKARPAPFAPATPWAEADKLYVAQHARGSSVVVADYVWQTEAFPYTLTRSARTAILMHDLLHSRAKLFQQTSAADSVAGLSRSEEMNLMAKADAVLAIQAAEGEEVRAMLPQTEVVLVPMTARPVAEPRAGEDDRLLFVGSNTAPNVHGINWFFEKVWPAVRTVRPRAELLVAGNVARSLAAPPAGVKLLGVVDDLEPLYAAAGVVISPLTTGSGLKIKLVEALAQGKACVVTSVTLQGVEDEAGAAVALADNPVAFAAATSALLADVEARRALGAAALDVVEQNFSPERAHAPFTAWLGRPLTRGAVFDRQAMVREPKCGATAVALGQA